MNSLSTLFFLSKIMFLAKIKQKNQKIDIFLKK